MGAGSLLLVICSPLVITACLAIKLLCLSFALSLPDWVVHRQVWSATLGSLMLVVAPFFLLPHAWRFVLLLATDIGLSSLMLADLLHLHFFRDVLSIVELSEASQLHMGIASIAATLRPSHGLLFLDVLILGLLFPVYLRARRRLPPLRFHVRAASCALLTTAGALVGFPAALLVWRDSEEVFLYAVTRRQVVSAIGLFPYHIFDAAHYFKYPLSGRWSVSDADVERVRRFLKQRQTTRASISPLFGAAKGRNVIVVMCESLQAFPVGLGIRGGQVTPSLVALARESLRFENFYDQTHMGATSDGEFISLQSLHPVDAGAVATRYVSNHYRALPAILAERGYTTLSAIGQPGESWNMRIMHPRLGFQKRFYEEDLAPGEKIGLGLSDREFFRQMFPILVQQPTPFLAFLITLTNHHPYVIPARDHELDVGTLRGSVLGNYLQSVHYFDRALGDFVERLRESGLLDSSILVVYGDHHGWLEDTPDLAELLRFTPGNSYRYWLTRKRLPLLIRLPGGAHAGARSVTSGHLDIAPTLLTLLGIEETRTVMLGEDLTQARVSPVVYRDGSFTDGMLHWTRQPGSSAGECFEQSEGKPLSCASLRERHEQALEQLQVSDLIIRGDLILKLLPEGAVKDAVSDSSAKKPIHDPVEFPVVRETRD